MEKAKDKEIVTVTLRYPKELREQLKVISERERRSLNEQIVYVLERWVEQQKNR